MINQAPRYEDVEVEVQLHAFLTSVPDGGKWSASCPGHFTSEQGPLIPNG